MCSKLECGGCEHGRLRTRCEESPCTGKKTVHAKCVHNKSKINCKHVDCSGCPHGHLRRNCEDGCGGKAIKLCPHGEKKSSCKDLECGGCEHDNLKRLCSISPCTGRAANFTRCPHGKQKGNCGKSECSGCIHNVMNCFTCNPEGRVKKSKYMNDWNAGVVGKKHKRGLVIGTA